MLGDLYGQLGKIFSENGYGWNVVHFLEPLSIVIVCNGRVSTCQGHAMEYCMINAVSVNFIFNALIAMEEAAF